MYSALPSDADAANTCRLPFLPTPEQPPLPRGGIAGPGAASSAPIVPISDVTTPMCTFGKPPDGAPGSELSSLTKFGKFLTRLFCLSAIDGESSIRNSRSRSGFSFSGNALTSRSGASTDESFVDSAGYLHPTTITSIDDFTSNATIACRMRPPTARSAYTTSSRSARTATHHATPCAPAHATWHLVPPWSPWSDGYGNTSAGCASPRKLAGSYPSNAE